MQNWIWAHTHIHVGSHLYMESDMQRLETLLFQVVIDRTKPPVLLSYEVIQNDNCSIQRYIKVWLM